MSIKINFSSISNNKLITFNLLIFWEKIFFISNVFFEFLEFIYSPSFQIISPGWLSQVWYHPMTIFLRQFKSFLGFFKGLFQYKINIAQNIHLSIHNLWIFLCSGQCNIWLVSLRSTVIRENGGGDLSSTVIREKGDP